jgi:hypothetical protein
MTTLAFDEKSASITIETRAKGMLAKLAHDLSIESKDATAAATWNQGRIEVELGVPVRSLAVQGVLKGGGVDRGVLSASDRAEIERKIREEVLRGGTVRVRMETALGEGALADGSRSVDASGTIEVGGKSARLGCRCRIEVASGRASVEARGKVSLSALSIPPVKGPLGAFRVDDEIAVACHLAFVVQG